MESLDLTDTMDAADLTESEYVRLEELIDGKHRFRGLKLFRERVLITAKGLLVARELRESAIGGGHGKAAKQAQAKADKIAAVLRFQDIQPATRSDLERIQAQYLHFATVFRAMDVDPRNRTDLRHAVKMLVLIFADHSGQRVGRLSAGASDANDANQLCRFVRVALDIMFESKSHGRIYELVADALKEWERSEPGAKRPH
jgi:hypothetical protein